MTDPADGGTARNAGEQAGHTPPTPPEDGIHNVSTGRSVPAYVGGSLLVESGSARAFQRDLYFYWSTVRDQPLSLTQEGRLYQKDLRRVVNASTMRYEQSQAQAYTESGRAEAAEGNELDRPRFLFMRLLLTDLGLLQREGQLVQAAAGAAAGVPAFLTQRPQERIRQAFLHWQDGSFWNETLSIPDILIHGAGTRLDPAPAPIVHARKRVLGHITQVCQGQAEHGAGYWIPIQQLILQIQASDYHFFLPRERGLPRDYAPYSSSTYRTYESYLRHPSPYISYGNEMGWSFSPPIEDEAEGWRIVEASLIRAILFEPLFWMGLVDIGYLNQEGTPGGARAGRQVSLWPVAFRLTPVGAWVLGIGPEVDIPQQAGKVVLQPNFELFALDPISDLVLAELDEFAERITAERVIKYRLTRESIYQAQKSGWTVDRILQTLSELSPGEPQGDTHSSDRLPQNVVRTLQEWQALHERITIHRRANLLHATDSALLDHLADDPVVERHLMGHRPGTPLALVPATLGASEVLARILEEKGYPPLRTRSRRDTRSPFTLIEGGERAQIAIQFDVALPSIHVLDRLAPFTLPCASTARAEPSRNAPSAADRLCLTPASLQKALQQGMTVAQILEQLQDLYDGPLPSWVERRIHAWSHYYGSASIQRVTLVQVRDAKTLRELLQEPRLQAILRPLEPDGDSSLAVVDESDLDSLYEVFDELGIAVRDQALPLVQAQST